MLEQRHVARTDDLGHDRAQGAVVDGVGQGVAGTRRREVELDVEVDLQGLGPLGLLGQGAAAAEEPEAPQLDGVGTGAQADASAASTPASATSSRPVGPSWRDRSCSLMAMARVVSGTSPA